MDKRKFLSQYYSSTIISDLMLGCVNGRPDSVLDLAAGKGDLLLAAQRRFPDVDIYANDIDKDNTRYSKSVLPQARTFCANALTSRGLSSGVGRFSPYDLVVGNPPFGVVEADKHLQKMIFEALGVSISIGSAVRQEVAFLAKSIFHTANYGYVSIVLPKTLSRGLTHKKLRRGLMERHELYRVIDLPKNSFAGTEVETTIWAIKKGRPTVKNVVIQQAGHLGEIIGELIIPPNEAINRLDYQYHSWRASYPSDGLKIGDLALSIERGNVYYTQAQELGLPVFHTSHFKLAKNGIMHFQSGRRSTRNLCFVSAKKNDILLPRVGRSLSNSALVGSGESFITDCVYRLRVPRKHIVKVKESLQTSMAREWLEANASGSCAKLVAKATMLEMPIFA